jgi:hypothetical protein
MPGQSDAGDLLAAPKQANAPIPVIKGNLQQIFRPVPIDTTVIQSKFIKYGQSTNTVTPLTFHLPMTENFIDMTRTMLEVDVQFWRAPQAQAAAVPLRPTDRAFPNANVGHTLINQAELLVNQTSTGEVASRYNLKPYLQRTYNHTEEEKKYVLTPEGYYGDEAGHFNDTNPFDDPIPAAAFWAGGIAGLPNAPNINTQQVLAASLVGAGNAGAANAAHTTIPTQPDLAAFIVAAENRRKVPWGIKKRHAMVVTPLNAATPAVAVKVKFFISLAIDLFQCKRLLVPGCKLDFTIRWNTPQLAMMAAAGQALGASEPYFEVVNNSPRLWICHVDLRPDLHNLYENAQLNGKYIASYPHMTTRIVTQVVPDGRRHTMWSDVFTGNRPNYMILGFLPQMALTGSYLHNPYNFADMHQDTVRVTINGQEIPLERMDLRDPTRLEAYMTLPIFTGDMMESKSVGIGRDNFMQGHYVLCYNFNPDGEQGNGYNYSKNQGIITIEVNFSADTADNTTLVAYAEFENAFWVDGEKNTTLMHTY